MKSPLLIVSILRTTENLLIPHAPLNFEKPCATRVTSKRIYVREAQDSFEGILSAAAPCRVLSTRWALDVVGIREIHRYRRFRFNFHFFYLPLCALRISSGKARPNTDHLEERHPLLTVGKNFVRCSTRLKSRFRSVSISQSQVVRNSNLPPMSKSGLRFWSGSG